jgi:hypothetical protein
LIGEDILKLNYELTKDRNYFKSYKFRTAQAKELEHDIQTLLRKYSVEDTANILGVPICKVKAHVARAEAMEEQRRVFLTTGQIEEPEDGAYVAIFKD